MRLSDHDVAVFTDELAIPCRKDALAEVSDIINTDGLISGDTYRISTYKVVDGVITEDRVLLLITVP